MPREHHDFYERIGALYLTEGLDSVFRRHEDVEDNHVNVIFPDGRKALVTAERLTHLKAASLQSLSQSFDKILFIVDKKDAHLHCSTSSPLFLLFVHDLLSGPELTLFGKGCGHHSLFQ